MDAARRVATHDHLARVARAALGAGHRLIGLARLRGGSKKGVYRLTFDDDSTAIVYIWDDAENYWPAAHAGDHADPFSHASGIELFQAASRHLDTLGIRTPRIHLADRSRSLYPADIAVVEDVPGGNLETLLQQDPRSAEPTLTRLADALRVMQRHTGPGFGKVALIDNGGTSHGRSCEQVVLDQPPEPLNSTVELTGPVSPASRDRPTQQCGEHGIEVGRQHAGGRMRRRRERLWATLVTGHPVVQMVFAVSFRDDLGDPAYLAGVGRAGRNTNCPLRSLVRQELKQWCLTA